MKGEVADRLPEELPVPFVDLDRQHAPIAGELRRAVDEVIARGDFILGEAVDRFEEAFARHVGVKHAIGVGSGTAALTIAARSAGIGAGDEVIVPAHTYVASAFGLEHAGARAIFCDVEPETGLIDLSSAEAVLSERTAAILPVHLYGQLCDGERLRNFARRHGLALIEDAAQAHGARRAGGAAGSLGAAAAFSFYPSKNLGAFGDGGMVCTDDDEIAERARRLRHLGQRRKGEHLEVGMNERLDSVQAAILAVKLERLEEWNESRRLAAARYSLRLGASVPTLPSAEGSECVFHLFPIRVPERARVARFLRDRGISTGIHYCPPVHLQPAFAERDATAPEAEAWAEEELSLPMFPFMKDEEIDRVCSGVLDAIQAIGAPPAIVGRSA